MRRLLLALTLVGLVAAPVAAQNTVTTVPDIVGQYDFFNGRVVAADGTAALPSLTFASDPDTGRHSGGGGTIVESLDGVARYQFQGGGFDLTSIGSLNWFSGALGTTRDVTLVRDAPNTIAQRNGLIAQTHRIFNTFTSATNNERGELEWVGNTFRIGTKAGSVAGIARDLILMTDNTSRWTIGATSGHLTSAAPTAGVGYGTGAGGTVTQATSKSTGVTLNTVTGEITMNAASLASQTTVSFTLTNSTIAAGDLIMIWHVSGGTLGAYGQPSCLAAAGSATCSMRNVHTASLSEAIVLKYAVFKATTS